MIHNLNLNFQNHKEKAKYYSNTNSVKVWNTNERDLAPTQKIKKTGQKENNQWKIKVTTKHENTCLKHNHQLRVKKHLANKQPHTMRSLPTKNHKALNRRDQSSKRLTPHTYTKGSRKRRKTT